MSQKLLDTRIGLKYDTLANWQSVENSFQPLAGEVVFYEMPVPQGSEEMPAILFKVGNGTDKLVDLPFGSAIAADVYAWAKQQSLLGGQYNSGTGWDFSHAETEQVKSQDEVGGFVGNLVKLRVVADPVEENTYNIEVSTDGGHSWTPSGTIHMTPEIYSGDDTTIAVENNIISVIPANLGYTSGSGIDIGTAGGVLTSEDVEAITDYIDDKAAANEVTVVKLANAETGYASSYEVRQNGQKVGDTINIPKDFLVKSAELKTVTVADEPYEGAEVGDKYIDFVVNTYDGTATDTHIYLPVKDLVDVYTGGNTDYISVSVDNNNIITATLRSQMIAGSIDSGTGADMLPTVDAVREYVQEEIDNATPNIEAGDGIEVTTSGTTKTVAVNLDETNSTITDNAGSGLVATSDGLRIDDSLVWVLQSGGATSNID